MVSGNALTVNNLTNNDGFGVGLDFSDFVDLRNQKFNLQIDSAINNLNPMIIYLYFHSIISV